MSIDDDEDERFKNAITINGPNSVRPINSAEPSLDASEMPPQGGVVNRWLDRFRKLDNEARTELMQSVEAKISAQESLAKAHISFEKTKAKLRNLEEILDNEDAIIKHDLKRQAHERRMEEKKWEQEAKQWDPEPEPRRGNRSRNRNRQPQKSEEEKLWEEAEMIMEHGTTSDRGAIAKEVYQSNVSKYGEDVEQWPADKREFARRLHFWAMQDQ